MPSTAELAAMQTDRGSERDGFVDGDASAHLEELVAGVLAPLVPEPDASGVDVELVGPHLRLSGTIVLGRFRRLSDYLNSHEGLIPLRNATVLRRNGDPTKVTAASIWVSPDEVSLIGEPGATTDQPAAPEFRLAKVPRSLIVVTPGHTLTGSVFIPEHGDLDLFIESKDPVFVPLRDARTRSLADRRVIQRYPFALLNRRHIVAATELQPGMAPAGRSVL